MMRTRFLYSLIILSSTVFMSMNPRAKHITEGSWYPGRTTSKVTIAPCGNKFCGTITWIKDPSKAIKNGEVGAVIFKDFTVTDQHTLEGGKIYDPRNDKWYSGRLKVGSDGRLEVRGWVGMPTFGKSMHWTRAN
ncbi:DUF2147 domain-containing protein [Dyadobacter sp. Leaf189]|uniref:DUF2147 domain-containing protein n=1 Tax=Dyadobacter sp. Leaf189 TaxID=1736295 RepID=UPI0009EBAC6F|nr:DUF2147 domain-containing protein [Dyadobacter sp. Leaf189]